MSKEMGKSMSNGKGGHLYTQTNEVKNAIIHYTRGEDGELVEIDRVSTSGAPVRSNRSAARKVRNAPRARAAYLSPDRRFLFTTNGGTIQSPVSP